MSYIWPLLIFFMCASSSHIAKADVQNFNSISTFSQQYIVTFNSYRLVQEHENKIQQILLFSPPSSWRFVNRKNKPSIHLPTDFIIIETVDNFVLSHLRNHHAIYTVSKQTQHNRSLQNLVRNLAAPLSEQSPTHETYQDHNSVDRNQRRNKRASILTSEEDSLKKHAFGSGYLWKKGFTGKGVKVAVFDTGLLKDRRYFPNVVDETDWTGEQTTIDKVGHGTFVAGLIGGRHPSCPGIAPDVDLYIFKVFTGSQVSYTSWFLDAFNYALHIGINVLNLSIGGPDFADDPFTDKINELTAHGVIITSAIGNDGPLWGSLNNPGDMMEVIGVGGAEPDGTIASFSSRGMTSQETQIGANGYGRVKPDLVAYARSLLAPSHNSIDRCNRLSGTSVASPVVAGAVALLASTVPLSRRSKVINPASMKRALLKSARPFYGISIYEQGAGLLDIEQAFEQLKIIDNELLQAEANLRKHFTDPLNTRPWKRHQYKHGSNHRHDTLLSSSFSHSITSREIQTSSWSRVVGPQAFVFPSYLDLRETECTMMWPHCAQPLIKDASPVTLNVTVLNVAGVEGRIDALEWIPKDNGNKINVTVTPPARFWPWAAGLGIHLSTTEIPQKTISAEGVLRFQVVSVHERFMSVVHIPIKVLVSPPPPREKRILWDIFHSIQYPPGYIPRDNLVEKNDMLDWLGDHPHTNFHRLFREFIQAGFHVDILDEPLSCRSITGLKRYGALLLIDSEDSFTRDESSIISKLVKETGLTLVVAADWYNLDVMNDIQFEDDNTRSMWTAIMAGSNVPALNEILREHGIAFGDTVVSGNLAVRTDSFRFESGVPIVQFPRGGELLLAPIMQITGHRLTRSRYNESLESVHDFPVLGVSKSGQGMVLVYGDTNCIDTAYQGGKCYGFFVETLRKTIQCSEKDACNPILHGGKIIESDIMPHSTGPRGIARPLPDKILDLFQSHSKVMRQRTQFRTDQIKGDADLCQHLPRLLRQEIPTQRTAEKIIIPEPVWNYATGKNAKYYQALDDTDGFSRMISLFGNRTVGFDTLNILNEDFRIRPIAIIMLGAFLIYWSFLVRRGNRPKFKIGSSHESHFFRNRGRREMSKKYRLLPSVIPTRSRSSSEYT